MLRREMVKSSYLKARAFAAILLLSVSLQGGTSATPDGNAQNRVRSSSQWILKKSSVTSKPNCCFFCDDRPGCYDQDNHQRRHSLYFLVQSLVSGANRPPAYCIPDVDCTEKGSPFKSLASTVTESDNYYTISGDVEDNPTSYSRLSTTLSANSVVSIADGASVQVASGQILSRSSWFDILQSTLVLQRVLLRGKLNVLYLSTGTLNLNSASLDIKDSPVLINEGSTISGVYASISFAISPANDAEAEPVPFIMSGSSLSLQKASINFVNHPDVYFDSCVVKMHAASFRAVNSNIRFFDSVLDLRGTTTVLDNSQVWLFNTTLIRDNTISKVFGEVPVKLNDLLWGKPTNIKASSGTVLIRSS